MPALNKIDSNNLYPMKPIKNDKDHQKALRSMEAVFDINKGRLAEYAEALAILIEHYEENRYPVKNTDGIKNLKFLMDQNNLKQKDLVGIIGGKSAVSEIINGKRPLHLNHIRKLAKRFHVKPASFL
jgi:HTH-type transcriptional regulator/antitoxin HigA